jgi:hypothetical protein
MIINPGEKLYASGTTTIINGCIQYHHFSPLLISQRHKEAPDHGLDQSSQQFPPIASRTGEKSVDRILTQGAGTTPMNAGKDIPSNESQFKNGLEHGGRADPAHFPYSGTIQKRAEPESRHKSVNTASKILIWELRQDSLHHGRPSVVFCMLLFQ